MGRTFGPERREVYTSADSASIAVASTATVYTKSFDLKYGAAFGVDMKATSDGTVKVKVELEQGTSKPTTEGSADTSWAVPEVAPITITVEDENMHVMGVSPIPLRYARFKLTGLTGNAASTVLAMGISIQEEV
jgi:hypothetical protein